MNKQRLDAFLDLIKQLLKCRSEDEGEILAANQDLLDAGFLQILEIA